MNQITTYSLIILVSIIIITSKNKVTIVCRWLRFQGKDIVADLVRIQLFLISNYFIA